MSQQQVWVPDRTLVNAVFEAQYTIELQLLLYFISRCKTVSGISIIFDK